MVAAENIPTHHFAGPCAINTVLFNILKAEQIARLIIVSLPYDKPAAIEPQQVFTANITAITPNRDSSKLAACLSSQFRFAVFVFVASIFVVFDNIASIMYEYKLFISGLNCPLLIQIF